ncbi:MAG TPA: pyrroline-5-carboxylate reductase [Microbacteriaceae bacterium]|nr:pyrroline-5-carboxylate reductase [Microbacteriaceae bacterium]
MISRANPGSPVPVGPAASGAHADAGTDAPAGGRPAAGADRPLVVAILGTGSMGTAVLRGLTGPEAGPAEIRVTTRSAAHAAALGGQDGVTSYAVESDPDANRLAARGADLVVLAVKPHLIPGLAGEIGDVIDAHTIVVSVAAGVAIATIAGRLPAGVAVLRAMPNTPAVIGRGVTGLSVTGGRGSAAALRVVHDLFARVGEVVEVPEDRLDALSAVSGSGPAYVFLLIEKLTAAAVRLGFAEREAARLVAGTFRGAAELLAAGEAAPAELRRQVTSPHGTTERAIAVLEEAGLDDLFGRALEAALARARELAAEGASRSAPEA